MNTETALSCLIQNSIDANATEIRIYFEEAVSGARWVSFSLVWFGLVIFSVEGLYVYQQHRARQLPRN